MILPVKILVAGAIGVLTIGGTVAANLNNQPPQKPQVRSNTVSEPETTEQTETIASVNPVETSAPAVAAPSPTPPPVAAAPTPPASSYRVNDRTGILVAAGIAPDDRPIVEAIIDQQTGWNFKKDGNSRFNLCLISPPAIAGFEDFADNPITQLKYCQKYIFAKYGDWKTARDFLTAQRYL